MGSASIPTAYTEEGKTAKTDKSSERNKRKAVKREVDLRLRDFIGNSYFTISIFSIVKIQNRIKSVFSVALPPKKHRPYEQLRVRAPRGDVKIFDFDNRRSARATPAAQIPIVKRSFTIDKTKSAHACPFGVLHGHLPLQLQYNSIIPSCQCGFALTLLHFCERKLFL